MTTLNETYVNSLKINRLTKTQLNNATELSPSEAYWEDPEFVGGKLLETTADGDIVESSQTIPTKTSDITNDSGFITGITSSDVTTALGYTPYDASNPNGYTSNVGTVTSVNNTSPDGNGNVTLSIPTVNDSTITITQGGVTKGSFTLNQSSGDTIALDAGGNTTRAGTIILYAGSTAPTGYLVCDGSAISRTTYSDLFDAIGTTYGSGDGSTTFNLPDFVDRVVQGGTAGTYKSAGLPNITGSVRSTNRTDTGETTNGFKDFSGAFYNSGNLTHNVTATAAGSYQTNGLGFDASLSNSIYGGSTTVQPPALCVNVCIKY